MTDEVIADQTASEPTLTAAQAPEQNVTPEDKSPRTFTQEELDAAIGKRLAREQRKWEREQAARNAETQSRPIADDLKPDQFESVEQYADALAVRKAEEMLRQREAHRQQSQALEAYHDREEEARAKYDDFEQVAYNPNLPITNVMAETIQASDIGPEVAYYLGTNPREADRIARLTPYLQAMEIGKIEAKLSANPPVKKTSNAPAPIAPVSARSSSTPAFDTTDPRSIKTMTTSQWIEEERKRQIRKMEAQRR